MAFLENSAHLVYAIRGGGGIYIGCTAQTIESRFADHVGAAKCGRHLPLYVAMREHGVAAFTIELLKWLPNRRAGLAFEKRMIVESRAQGLNVFNKQGKAERRWVHHPYRGRPLVAVPVELSP